MTVIARYDFNETTFERIDDSAPEAGDQFGWYMGSSYAENGTLILDGKSSYAKIYANDAFQLDRGTLEFQFSSSSARQEVQTIASRDSSQNTPGSFRLELMPDGSLRSTHKNESEEFVSETKPGFVGTGDEIRVTYSWDAGGTGGRADIRNLTTGETFSVQVPSAFGMNMGGVNQNWFFGAGQQNVLPEDLKNVDQFFHGKFSYVQFSDTVDNCPVIPCFTAGTLIATAEGWRPVEVLRAGDRVITRDNGVQRLIWVGHRQLDSIDLRLSPALAPIKIGRGALGKNQPERDLLVSPNHRMLINAPENQLHFGQTEVLVAAKFLVGQENISQMPQTSVTYVHIMFERHELVIANGCWSESFYPGAYIVSHAEQQQRDEIIALFSELEDGDPGKHYPLARRALTRAEAELCVQS